MAAKDCLNVVRGTKRKRALRDELNKAVDERIRQLGPEYADDFKAHVAIRELTAEYKRELRARRFKRARQFMAERAAIARLDLFEGDPARGARSLYVPDKRGARLESNFQVRAASLIMENNGLMPSLAEVRPKVFRWSVGTQTRFNENIIKEAGGISTGDATARRIVAEWRVAAKDAWNAFKAAGGQGGTLDDFFLPQDWEVPLMIQAGKETWIADARARLDRTRMKDVESGALMTDEQIDDLLDYAYEAITTEGYTKWIEPTGAPDARRSIARKRDRSRVLHFTREGESEMRAKYMNDDMINAMANYRDRLLEDTAILQLFGPNPDRTFSVLENAVKGRSAGTLPRLFDEIQEFHEIMLNRQPASLSESGKEWAERDRAFRAATTGILLGAAAVPSAAGDTATQLLNSWATGTSFRLRMEAYVTSLLNREDGWRRAAQDLMIVDTLADAESVAARYDPDLAHRATRISRFAQQVTLEKSGLVIHTKAGRDAALVSHRAEMGKDLGKSWRGLSPVRRGFYESYGITEAMWNDVITKTTPATYKSFLREIPVMDVTRLRDVDKNIFRRVHEMLYQESTKSLLSSDVQAEGFFSRWMLGGARRGTMSGFLAHQLRLFKSFPVMAAFNLREAALNPYIPKGRKLTAFALFGFTSLVLGGVALQARQILQGRDPIPLQNEDGSVNTQFLIMSFLYGGGAPFIGDTLPDLLGFDLAKGAETRRNVIDILPTVGLGFRIFKPTGEAIGQLYDGEYEQAARTFGGEQMAELGRNLAALSGGNIWYLRTALDRLIFSEWEALVDPSGFEDKTNRREAWLKSQGQDYFWTPGEFTPERAPAF